MKTCGEVLVEILENYGIDTIWFNPENKRKEMNIKPTYEVCDFDHLLNILET